MRSNYHQWPDLLVPGEDDAGNAVELDLSYYVCQYCGISIMLGFDDSTRRCNGSPDGKHHFIDPGVRTSLS